MKQSAAVPLQVARRRADRVGCGSPPHCTPASGYVPDGSAGSVCACADAPNERPTSSGSHSQRACVTVTHDSGPSRRHHAAQRARRPVCSQHELPGLNVRKVRPAGCVPRPRYFQNIVAGTLSGVDDERAHVSRRSTDLSTLLQCRANKPGDVIYLPPGGCYVLRPGAGGRERKSASLNWAGFFKLSVPVNFRFLHRKVAEPLQSMDQSICLFPPRLKRRMRHAGFEGEKIKISSERSASFRQLPFRNVHCPHRTAGRKRQ